MTPDELHYNTCESCRAEYQPAAEGTEFFCEKCANKTTCIRTGDMTWYEFSPQFFRDAHEA